MLIIQFLILLGLTSATPLPAFVSSFQTSEGSIVNLNGQVYKFDTNGKKMKLDKNEAAQFAANPFQNPTGLQNVYQDHSDRIQNHFAMAKSQDGNNFMASNGKFYRVEKMEPVKITTQEIAADQLPVGLTGQSVGYETAVDPATMEQQAFNFHQQMMNQHINLHQQNMNGMIKTHMQMTQGLADPMQAQQDILRQHQNRLNGVIDDQPQVFWWNPFYWFG